MTDVAAGIEFVSDYTRNSQSLAGVVLFEDEGAQADKQYVYVLSRSRVTETRATLDVVNMDGTVGEITITTADYNDIFRGNDDAFGMAYAYTTDANGVSELTVPDFSSSTDTKADNLMVYRGYAWQLRNGTIELFGSRDKSGFVDSFSYSGNIWNVEGVTGDDETAGAGYFSTNVGAQVILVVDANNNTVRAAFIKDVLEGMYAGSIALAGVPALGATTTVNVAAAGDTIDSVTSVTDVNTGSPVASALLSYEWFSCDSAGNGGVSLLNNNGYTGANTRTLSFKNGNKSIG